jgi:hypothetical protein
MDVRAFLSILDRQTLADSGSVVSRQPLPDSLIEIFIGQADSIIRGYLQSIYGSSYAATAYFRGPHTIVGDGGAVELRGVILANSATLVTEQWLIEFTGNSAYRVNASFSGSQGTGTIAADFTSTSGEIQIKAADWYNPSTEVVGAGTVVVFSTYVVNPTVNNLSASLAAATAIDYLYGQSESKPNSYAALFRKNAMDMLGKLIDPDSDVSLLTTNSLSTGSMEAIEWNINRYGTDVTNYSEITDDIDPMGI